MIIGTDVRVVNDTCLNDIILNPGVLAVQGDANVVSGRLVGNYNASIGVAISVVDATGRVHALDGLVNVWWQVLVKPLAADTTPTATTLSVVILLRDSPATAGEVLRALCVQRCEHADATAPRPAGCSLCTALPAAQHRVTVTWRQHPDTPEHLRRQSASYGLHTPRLVALSDPVPYPIQLSLLGVTASPAVNSSTPFTFADLWARTSGNAAVGAIPAAVLPHGVAHVNVLLPGGSGGGMW